MSKNVSVLEEARQYTAREHEHEEIGIITQANRIEDVISRGRDSTHKKQNIADKDNSMLPAIGMHMTGSGDKIET